MSHHERTTFLDKMRNEGWRSVEAKNKDQRERSSWISPDGKWYNVPFADHQIFAHYVLKDKYQKETEIDKAGDLLSREFHWILIHHEWITGTILMGANHMTFKQYKVLLEFFGDEPLFRGWTIKRFYDKARVA